MTATLQPGDRVIFAIPINLSSGMSRVEQHLEATRDAQSFMDVLKTQAVEAIHWYANNNLTHPVIICVFPKDPS